MINNSILIKNKVKFTFKLWITWIRKNYQFDIYRTVHPIFFNFNEFFKLANYNEIFVWKCFYLNIKSNDNNREMFLSDLDFLSKKLICIVSHIDNSIEDVNFNIMSMLFAIHETDINEFKNRNIDTSKFYILNKNTRSSVTIFKCTLNLNEKPYDEELDDIAIVNLAKVAIHLKKMNQLLNLFILVDDESYKNLYIEHKDPSLLSKNEYWLFENFCLNSKDFYLKIIKGEKYNLLIGKEKVQLKEIIIRNYFINYYQILGDEEK